MMRAYVRLRLPDGSASELGHGDLIGRLWSAALPISDARVSEAHAMVSLRGQELLLLPLRGRFAVDGQRQSSLVLAAGQRITFADGLDLVVEEVSLPAAVFAVEGDGLPRVVVSGVCSLLTRPRPELVPRLLPDAPAHLWGDGEGWCLTMNGETRPLQVGDTWELDGRRFRAVGLSLDTARGTVTRLDGSVARPLRVVAQFDTVHIHSEGGGALALSGLAARLISEVVAFDGPVAWEVLAGELWPDEDDTHLLRHKLDVTLSRLRSRLRDGRVRPDLVRSDGFGKVELFLLDGDVVEDRT
ncbi:MAG: FHA domain-containing protein [Myxococcota bacterium]